VADHAAVRPPDGPVDAPVPPPVDLVLELPDAGLAQVLAEDAVIRAKRARRRPALECLVALAADDVAAVIPEGLILVEHFVRLRIGHVNNLIHAVEDREELPALEVEGLLGPFLIRDVNDDADGADDGAAGAPERLDVGPDDAPAGQRALVIRGLAGERTAVGGDGQTLGVPGPEVLEEGLTDDLRGPYAYGPARDFPHERGEPQVRIGRPAEGGHLVQQKAEPDVPIARRCGRATAQSLSLCAFPAPWHGAHPSRP